MCSAGPMPVRRTETVEGNLELDALSQLEARLTTLPEAILAAVFPHQQGDRGSMHCLPWRSAMLINAAQTSGRCTDSRPAVLVERLA